ncbi:MAG: CinA family protein [Lawsonibacter sp.]
MRAAGGCQGGHGMEEARLLLQPTVEEMEQRFGAKVYGVDVPSLEAVVENLLREKGMTMGTAESCTGGLMAKRLTDMTGACRSPRAASSLIPMK